ALQCVGGARAPDDRRRPRRRSPRRYVIAAIRHPAASPADRRHALGVFEKSVGVLAKSVGIFAKSVGVLAKSLGDPKDALGVPFGAAETGMVCDGAILESRHLAPDPRLGAYLLRHAEVLLSRLPVAAGLVEQVQRLVAEELRGGDPSQERVAKKIGMSTRTLQ